MKIQTPVQLTMKTIPRLFGALCASLFFIHQPQAAAASGNETGVQLSIELRDGSHVVGKSLEDTPGIHSAALGDMKLPWAGIRSIEYAGTNTSAARLTATNGDVFAITLAAESLRVETGFGQTELPVKLLRSVRVSPAGRVAASAGTGTAQLGIELRDGSHVVGKALDDNLSFHSPAMGDLKLTWAGIRSLEYAGTNTDMARLTATNGDVYEVQFTVAAVRVETSFGKTELPVKLIRRVIVSGIVNTGGGPAFNIDFGPGKGDPSKQTGPAAVGREGDFWNSVAIAFNSDHTESGLKLANGQPSPIAVQMINLGGGWGNGGKMGVNSPMLDSFNYPVNNQGGNSQVILSHVPAGTYSLYIYGHGASPSYYGDYEVFVRAQKANSSVGGDYGRKRTSQGADASQNTEWVEDSQYVRFPAVEVPEDGRIEILIRPGGVQNEGGRSFADAIICGLQLVPDF
jgi:hypothetical protein